MQVSSTTSSPSATSASSGVVNQLKQKAAIVADGSGASDEEKVAAYTSIMRSMAQSVNTGSGWYQASTQADRDALNDIMQNSSIAKRIQKAADDFNQFGMSQARGSNVPAKSLAHLNGMSDLEQQLVVAGTALSGGVEDFKTFLQSNADATDKLIAADKAEQDAKSSKSAVKVTLSDKAKAALSEAQGADEAASDDPAAAALASLSKTDQGDGIASAALKMLQKAAEDRAEAKDEKAKAQTPSLTRAYETGERVDTSI